MRHLDPAGIEALARERGGTVRGVSPPTTEGTAKMKRPSKYRNVHTAYRGMTFASKAEAAYAKSLDTMTEMGIVRFWARQVPLMLGCPENRYVVDFLVWPHEGLPHAVDVKGAETPKFKRDKKLWLAYGPCDLRVITKSREVERITPRRPETRVELRWDPEPEPAKPAKVKRAATTKGGERP